MKIEVIGGGPAGLYAALLLRQRIPGSTVTVRERNRIDDTFGFGIVLSDETLGNLHRADASSWRAIADAFAYWDDLYCTVRGVTLKSVGHGFSGLERLRLLQILDARAREVGVEVLHGIDVPDARQLASHADLVIAADGINSLTREALRDAVQPSVDLRSNHFVWLGSTLPLAGFTYHFETDTDGNVWTVHAYQYKPGASTVVVEATERAFAASGLTETDEPATVAYLEQLFASFLRGHRLLANRSHWRRFPTVRCRKWFEGNIVLIGDAAHTAHFSIGSGTKLALEDAIALAEAVAASPADVPGALASYQATRADEVSKTQYAADVSLRWFEHIDRLFSMDPVQFNYSLLSRSKQITHENLRIRDRNLVEGVETWYQQTQPEGRLAGNSPPPPMFTPFRLRGMRLQNRVVVSPMCQYSAENGMPDDWHLMHLGARAVGGAGLVVTEMTCIAPDARITPGCTGIWSDAQTMAWKRIVQFVHQRSGARICLQLGHAGRKGSTQLGWEAMDEPLPDGNWPLVSSSPIPYFPHSQVPREMTRADMVEVRDQFVAATRRAEAAGFDMIELHMAHGYLLASFLSPVTNKRTDDYGGALENRMRWPLEVFAAMRAVWPEDKPMSVRLSATDWIEDEGLTGDDAVVIARALKEAGCDIVDVSTGQTDPASQPVYGRMFQTPYSEQIRLEVGMPTIAVGAISTADQVNTILAAGRADLVALARPHLADPHFTLRAAAEYDLEPDLWPEQYLSGRQPVVSAARKAQAEAEAQRAGERLLRKMNATGIVLS